VGRLGPTHCLRNAGRKGKGPVFDGQNEEAKKRVGPRNDGIGGLTNGRINGEKVKAKLKSISEGGPKSEGTIEKWSMESQEK